MKDFITLFAFCMLFNTNAKAQENYSNSNLAKIKSYVQQMHSTPINGNDDNTNQLTTGTLVYFQTSEGRLGVFEVKQYGYNLSLRAKTYRSHGSIFRQKEELGVRGTWSLDLDKMVESKTGMDFWWSQENNMVRKLVPKNGAKFYVVPKKNQLYGFVDMHAHPMSHLAFGGKVMHGAPDVGILVPSIPHGNGCRVYERARNIHEALGSCKATHGGWGFDNTCGDALRKVIVREVEKELNSPIYHQEEGAHGYPNFIGWPAHNNLTHQQMWVDWIKEAHEGGLSVMVALAVNNETYAAAFSGPGDRYPDDFSSANLQIQEIKQMVDRHKWMEIALTSEDLRRIVKSGKLAIILGMEVDNIGNFHKDSKIKTNQLDSYSREVVKKEIERLHYQGVRYIFPIHIVNNKFGGTAIYEDAFNLSNYHQTGRFWNIGCATSENVGYRFQVPGFDIALAGAKAKMGINPFAKPPNPPSCPYGHVNLLDLTDLGKFAITEMMKLGMMIDVDHMSERSVNTTLAISERHQYPLNAGHNGPRAKGTSERSLTLEQYDRLADLGGMAGSGFSNTNAEEFLSNWRALKNAMKGKNVAIGSDANGMEALPRPPKREHWIDYKDKESIYEFAGQKWDYNTQGMAHYGLFPQFIQSLSIAGMTTAEKELLFSSAEYFAQMWRKCEAQAANVR